jgi:hypothetical protein
METIEHTEGEYILDPSYQVLDLNSHHNETIIYVTTCKIGRTGPTGPIGPSGEIGPIGPSGEMGPMGPTGEKGSVSNTFIHVYTIKEQTVLQNNGMIK